MRLPKFRRVARAIVGDGEAARDVVQEAFAQALRGRAGFRGSGSLEGWLWRTVVNAARMHQRTRKASGDAQLRAREPAHRNGCENEPELRLHAAVAALPERQRLVLFLRYYADLDYAAIAESLQISPGTVAATLSSARSSLKRQLEEILR
jgi:RNA polymerase sigma-70 factor, ECF subfamily